MKIIEEKLKDKNFWVPVDYIFRLSSGGIIPKGEKFSDSETGYFYLRPKEVNFWGIDINNVPFLSLEVYNKLKKYKITSGEICISTIGTLGKVALVDTDKLEIGKENLILNGNSLKLSPKQEINHQFYYYYFYSFVFQAQINQQYTITTIKALGIDKWNYIKVPNIPLLDQEKIVAEIKTELDKQEEIRQRIENERDKIDEIIISQLEKNKV